MMWIFEWDIVTGDSAALDSIYAVSRDELDARDRRRASTRRRPGRRACAPWSPATDPATWRSPSCTTVLRRRPRLRDRPAAHARRVPRRSVLRHVQWLDTGSATRVRAVARRRAALPDGARRARAALRRRRRPAGVQLHRRRPGRGARRPRPRDGLVGRAVCWCAARCSSLVCSARSCAVASAGRGRAAGAVRRRRPGRGGWPRCQRRPARVDRVAGLGAAAGGAGGQPGRRTPGSPRRRTWSSRSAAGCCSPAIAAAAGRAAATRSTCGRRSAAWRCCAPCILLAALRPRGPGRYWFSFWTEPAAADASTSRSRSRRSAGCSWWSRLVLRQRLRAARRRGRPRRCWPAGSRSRCSPAVVAR